MRNIFTQAGHDSMVETAVDHLRSKGYSNIKAHISGYLQPTEINWTGNPNGHIPDVSANGNDKLHIFEVETKDSLGESHTRDQWKLFAAYAKQHNARFWVIAPLGLRLQADSLLSRLGITADIWEI